MKMKLLIATLAVGSLFVAPAFADIPGTKSTVETSAEEATVTAFVVAATGGG